MKNNTSSDKGVTKITLIKDLCKWQINQKIGLGGKEDTLFQKGQHAFAQKILSYLKYLGE